MSYRRHGHHIGYGSTDRDMNEMEMLERAARRLIKAHDARGCLWCETCNVLRPVLESLDYTRDERRKAGPSLAVVKSEK